MSLDVHDAAAATSPSRAEQKALQESATASMARHFPLLATRRRDAADPLDRTAWRALCTELDPVGLALPSEHGGEALGLEHLVSVAAAAGALVLPAPLLTTLAAIPLLADVAPELLAEVARGDVVVATADDVASIAWGADADLVLLVESAGPVVQLRLLDARHESVRSTRLPSVDSTLPRAVVHLSDAPVVASGSLAAVEYEAVVDAAMVLAAASAIGGARRLFALAVDYVGVRHQFGRPVGSFQAVQHRLAELHGELESAGAAVDRAARSTDRHRDALVAMIRAASAGDVVAREALHLHGGIGFTLEHDAHLYLKRSLVDRQLFGGRERLLELVAEQLSADQH